MSLAALGKAALKILLKSKAGKLIKGLLLALVTIYVGFLIGLAVIMFGFWNQFLCKATFGLFGDVFGTECDETIEVLTYEPIEEKDVLTLGENIFEARLEAVGKMMDEEALDFMKEHNVSKSTVDYPGDVYRMLQEGENSAPGSAIGGSGGGNYIVGGVHTYDPSYVEADYWQWALDASAGTGWDPIFILAQWRHETGNFTSSNFVKNNNIAGQTWTPKYPESMKGTARPRVESGWYLRYDDAVQGYVDFVNENPRYSKVKTLATAEQQLREVANQGWAVDPNYYNAISQMFNQLRKKYGDPGVQTPETRGGATKDGEDDATKDEDGDKSGGEGGEAEEKSEPDGVSGISAGGDQIVEIARRYLLEMGTSQADTSKRVSYLMGGDQLKQGGVADCSDFTQAVYKEAGITIGGTTVMQMFESEGEFVEGVENLAPGDLVFFNPGLDKWNPSTGVDSGHGYIREYNGKQVKVSHVGVYIGGGEFIHLGFGNGTIDTDTLMSGYYSDVFIAGKRWTAPGTDSYQPEINVGTGTINEAEMHLRALMQADLYALNALTLTPETLEEEIYKDKKIYKTWQVAKEVRDSKDGDYDQIQKRAEESAIGDYGQDWLAMNWILYTQQEAYRCYLLGDEEGILAWFKGLFGFGEKPCKELDKLYEKATGEKDAKFIKEEHRGMVKKQHVVIEEQWKCVNKPKDGQGLTFFKHKILGIPEKVYAESLNQFTSNGKQDCGEDAENVRTTTTTTYMSNSQIMQILYNFEEYSVYEKDVTVDGHDGTYPDKIDFILSEIYTVSEGAMGGVVDGVWDQVPSGDWIIPMEQGTYNFASPFGPRWGTLHAGVDMGTIGVQRVPVYAAAAGVVIAAGQSNSGLGSAITIDHKNGFYSNYGHFWTKDIVVKKGQVVQQGQLLGGAGNDAVGGSWHLHFEVCPRVSEKGSRLCREQIDPAPLLKNLSKNQDMAKTQMRAKQFDGTKDYSGNNEAYNKMGSRARGGEVIYMPGFTPKDAVAEEDTEVATTSGGTVQTLSVNKDVTGLFDDNAVTGHTLGFYKLTERSSSGGVGSLFEFGDYIQKNHPDYYSKLSPYDPRSDLFVARWKALSVEDPIGFNKAQKLFVESLK